MMNILHFVENIMKRGIWVMLELIIICIVVYLIIKKKKMKPTKEIHKKEHQIPVGQRQSSHNNLEKAQFVEKKTTGQSTYVGKRLPDWGNISSGEQLTICKYCGAENTLPSNVNKSKYRCYFCRELL